MAGAAWDGMRLMQKAQSAPGTKELRKEGCSEAFAMPMAEFTRLMNRFDAGPRTELPYTIVTCSAGLLRKTPTCEDLARTYAAAVPGGPSFVVVVQKPGTSDAVCSEVFGSDGTRLGGMEEVARHRIRPMKVADGGVVFVNDIEEDDEEDEEPEEEELLDAAAIPRRYRP